MTMKTTGHQTQQSPRAQSTNKKTVKNHTVPTTMKKKNKNLPNQRADNVTNNSTNASKKRGQSSAQRNKKKYHNNQTKL